MDRLTQKTEAGYSAADLPAALERLGRFEDFYESGGLKIYDMMLALNSRYGLHLKIFDMFRMGTPAEIADFIDQTEGIL